MSAPKVFISYSHDSVDHKRWVASFASKLRENGINAVLDQWELTFGDDITMFMESGVRNSQRVLVICTPEYVRKADAGVGGVGYERMIVTGELVSNIGTNKFIPVIRIGNDSNAQTPAFLSTRLFVDMRNDGESELRRLLEILHGAPNDAKPPIGESPFPGVDRNTQLIPTHIDTSLSGYFVSALSAAERADLNSWRKVGQKAKSDYISKIFIWREKYDGRFPNQPEAINIMLDEALNSSAGLMEMSMAGVSVSDVRFSDQRAAIDELLNIPDWNKGGFEITSKIPFALAYIFQAIHGALCLSTNQLDSAFSLVEMKVMNPHTGKYGRLFDQHECIAWPTTFSNLGTNPYSYLLNSFERLPWLESIFGTQQEFETCLTAYYLSLSSKEMLETLEKNLSLVGDRPPSLDIPSYWLDVNHHSVETAMIKLARNPNFENYLQKALFGGVFKEHWMHWAKLLLKSLPRNQGAIRIFPHPIEHFSDLLQ